MKEKKNIAVIMLLLTITILVVFAPMAVNALQNSARLDKKNYWHYNSETAGKITRRQVADLCYNDGISSVIEVHDPSRTKESFCRIMDSVFGENVELCDYLKSLWETKLLFSSKGSMLTVFDNNPVALNFINIGFGTETETIELTYEEKTNTVIYFHYVNQSGDDGVYEFLLSALNPLAVNHYKEEMGLSEDRYYFYSDVYEGGREIFFGLSQQSLKETDIL